MRIRQGSSAVQEEASVMEQEKWQAMLAAKMKMEEIQSNLMGFKKLAAKMEEMEELQSKLMGIIK